MDRQDASHTQLFTTEALRKCLFWETFADSKIFFSDLKPITCYAMLIKTTHFASGLMLLENMVALFLFDNPWYVDIYRTSVVQILTHHYSICHITGAQLLFYMLSVYVTCISSYLIQTIQMYINMIQDRFTRNETIIPSPHWQWRYPEIYGYDMPVPKP